MKLIYLLKQAKDSKKIEEFILQNLLTTSLEQEHDSENYVLSLKGFNENINKIDDFIFKDYPNIETANVIIGENRIGKTTLLRIIKDFLNIKIHDGLNNSFLGIFYDDSSNPSKLMYLSNLKNLKIDTRDFNNGPNLIQINDENVEKYFSENSIIYISDVIDKQDFFYNRHTRSELLFDASTSHSLLKASQSSRESKTISFSSPLSVYFNEEMTNQLNFVRKFQQSHSLLEFPLPQRLHLEFNLDLLMHTLEERFNSMSLKKSKKPAEKLLYMIKKNIQYLLLNDAEFSEVGDAMLNICLLDAFILKASLVPEEIDNKMMEFMTKIESILSISLEDFNSFTITEILDVFKKIFNLSFDSVFPYSFEEDVEVFIAELITPSKEKYNYNSYYLNLDSDKDFAVFTYFFEWFNDISHIPFIRFDWGMSTGETKLLNLYSLLYKSKIQRRTKTPQQNIWILIDEADSHLDPRWQSEYLHKLISVVSRIFTDRERIQIILTSHSPVLLSDLPHHNVCHLTMNESQNKVQRTFNQNIYSLFTDSFSLEATSGRLSSKILERIDRELQVLSDTKERSHDFQRRLGEIKNIVDIIGERIIRFAYQEKIDSLSMATDSRKVQKSMDLFKAMDKNERETLIKYIIDSNDEEEPLR
ncbi:AAA family ATPase [Exiguobacterium sp. s127]|uniref:AAA family ATPase n=1 Tax=Exiguobacterium sp. s127 TaxID=2751210 RepID=UPI001BE9B91E